MLNELDVDFVNVMVLGCLPSILQGTNILQSHGDTLLRSDTDISPHNAAHVYLEDKGLRSCEEEENSIRVTMCPLSKVTAVFI